MFENARNTHEIRLAADDYMKRLRIGVLEVVNPHEFRYSITFGDKGVIVIASEEVEAGQFVHVLHYAGSKKLLLVPTLEEAQNLPDGKYLHCFANQPLDQATVIALVFLDEEKQRAQVWTMAGEGTNPIGPRARALAQYIGEQMRRSPDHSGTTRVSPRGPTLLRIEPEMDPDLTRLADPIPDSSTRTR